MALSKKAASFLKYLAMYKIDPKTLSDRQTGATASPNPGYKQNTGTIARKFIAFKGAIKDIMAELIAAGPVISSFSPTSAAATATVVITGLRLTGATKVTFGGKPATSFVVNSATQITAVVSATAKSGAIQVTTPNGFNSKAGFVKS